MNPLLLDKNKIIESLKVSNSMTQLLKTLKYGRGKENIKILTNFIADNDIPYPCSFGVRKYTSVINSVSKIELQKIIDNSNSYNEILRTFDLRVAGSNSKTLKRLLIFHDIDCMKFEYNRHLDKQKILKRMRMNNSKIISYDEVKTKQFSSIRRYILRNELMPYECQNSECRNNGSHCGKPLTLELDHIDGDRNNNELSNLRFLCPNCHSQTETFSGKSRFKKQTKLCLCGKKLGKNNLGGVCSSCVSKNRPRVLKFQVTKEELTDLVKNHSLVSIGKMYGVSDNAIRKRCKKLKIDL